MPACKPLMRVASPSELAAPVSRSSVIRPSTRSTKLDDMFTVWMCSYGTCNCLDVTSPLLNMMPASVSSQVRVRHVITELTTLNATMAIAMAMTPGRSFATLPPTVRTIATSDTPNATPKPLTAPVMSESALPRCTPESGVPASSKREFLGFARRSTSRPRCSRVRFEPAERASSAA